MTTQSCVILNLIKKLNCFVIHLVLMIFLQVKHIYGNGHEWTDHGVAPPTSYIAVDGMPSIEEISEGLVQHFDLYDTNIIESNDLQQFFGLRLAKSSFLKF